MRSTFRLTGVGDVWARRCCAPHRKRIRTENDLRKYTTAPGVDQNLTQPTNLLLPGRCRIRPMLTIPVNSLMRTHLSIFSWNERLASGLADPACPDQQWLERARCRDGKAAGCFPETSLAQGCGGGFVGWASYERCVVPATREKADRKAIHRRLADKKRGHRLTVAFQRP